MNTIKTSKLKKLLAINRPSPRKIVTNPVVLGDKLYFTDAYVLASLQLPNTYKAGILNKEAVMNFIANQKTVSFDDLFALEYLEYFDVAAEENHQYLQNAFENLSYEQPFSRDILSNNIIKTFSVFDKDSQVTMEFCLKDEEMRVVIGKGLVDDLKCDVLICANK